jgi:hypothetical protein
LANEKSQRPHRKIEPATFRLLAQFQNGDAGVIDDYVLRERQIILYYADSSAGCLTKN